MEESKELLLKVEGYKAIANAEIRIGDITVVVGPNGSGKSTISHMVHTICNMSGMYDKYLGRKIWGRVEKLVNKLRDLGGCLSANDTAGEFSSITSNGVREEVQPDFKSQIESSGVTVALDKIKAYAEYVINTFYAKSNADSARAFAALVSYLNPDSNPEISSRIGEVILERLDEAKDLYLRLVDERDYEVYNESTQAVRRWLNANGVVRLSESGHAVYGTQNTGDGMHPVESLKEIFGIGKAFYITSPLVSTPRFVSDDRLGFNDGFTFRAQELDSLPCSDVFSVMRGGVETKEKKDFVDSDKGWVYIRKDGLKLDLSMCATGLMSFSILQILCRYGLLDEGTLLVIDEPEAHLHPKWIVEYARVLVELVKKLKIRLLLATHSPYFLNALEKLISDEQIGKTVRFYEMRETGEDTYSSYDVSGNLEPVYKSMYEPFL